MDAQESTEPVPMCAAVSAEPQQHQDLLSLGSRKRRLSESNGTSADTTADEQQPSRLYKMAKMLDEPSLMSLSDEILLEIMVHLDGTALEAMAGSCYRLRSVVEDPRLWNDFDFSQKRLLADQLEQRFRHLTDKTHSFHVRGHADNPTSPHYDNITLTKAMLIKLVALCPRLRHLSLDHSFLNTTQEYLSIFDFPATLHSLTMRHVNTHVPELSRTFFTRIDSHMSDLHTIRFEYCPWFHTHNLIVFSKLEHLRHLSLRGCSNMRDCVPYGSVSTRFGFKKLHTLDLRDTPVADSDIQCFNITRTLRELYLQAPAPPAKPDATAETAAAVAEAASTGPVCNCEESAESTTAAPSAGSSTAGSSAAPLLPTEAERYPLTVHFPNGHKGRPVTVRTLAPIYVRSWQTRGAPMTRSRSAKSSQTEGPEPNGGQSPVPSTGPVSASTAGPSPVPSTGPISASTVETSAEQIAGSSSLPNAGTSSEPTAGSSSQPTARKSSASTARPSSAPTVGASSKPTAGQSSEPSAGPSSAAAVASGATDRCSRCQCQLAASAADENAAAASVLQVPSRHMNVQHRQYIGVVVQGVNIANYVLNPFPVPGVRVIRDDSAHPRLIVMRGMAANDDNQGQHNLIAGELIERNRYITQQTARVFNYTDLITDRGVGSFGESSSNVRGGLIWIRCEARPRDTQLERVSLRGYRGITDITLQHLAESAPRLLHLDVRETSVTPAGVLAFRTARPTCELLVSVEPATPPPVSKPATPRSASKSSKKAKVASKKSPKKRKADDGCGAETNGKQRKPVDAGAETPDSTEPANEHLSEAGNATADAVASGSGETANTATGASGQPDETGDAANAASGSNVDDGGTSSCIPGYHIIQEDDWSDSD